MAVRVRFVVRNGARNVFTPNTSILQSVSFYKCSTLTDSSIIDDTESQMLTASLEFNGARSLITQYCLK